MSGSVWLAGWLAGWGKRSTVSRSLDLFFLPSSRLSCLQSQPVYFCLLCVPLQLCELCAENPCLARSGKGLSTGRKCTVDLGGSTARMHRFQSGSGDAATTNSSSSSSSSKPKQASKTRADNRARQTGRLADFGFLDLSFSFFFSPLLAASLTQDGWLAG